MTTVKVIFNEFKRRNHTGLVGVIEKAEKFGKGFTSDRSWFCQFADRSILAVHPGEAKLAWYASATAFWEEVVGYLRSGLEGQIHPSILADARKRLTDAESSDFRQSLESFTAFAVKHG
jgi:hypothetical protein